MNLHQLQVSFQPEEDRILFRVSFRKDDEPLQQIRAWLTRRLVKRLWPGLLEAMKKQVALDQPMAAHASTEIVSMQHQASLNEIRARGDFNVPFSEATDVYPQSETPVIITSVNIQLAAHESARITFVASEKMNFDVCFTKVEFHGFCTVLQDCMKGAEWDIGPALEMPKEAETGPRVLN